MSTRRAFLLPLIALMVLTLGVLGSMRALPGLDRIDVKNVAATDTSPPAAPPVLAARAAPPVSSGSAPEPRAATDLNAAPEVPGFKLSTTQPTPVPTATASPTATATASPTAMATPTTTASPTTTTQPTSSPTTTASPTAGPTPTKVPTPSNTTGPFKAAAAVAPAVAAAPAAAAAVAAAPYSAPETPQRMVPGLTYDVKVTVTNTTATAFTAANYALGYHWFRTDGTPAITLADCLKTPLPADLAPGAAVTLSATVKAPLIADIQNIREQFVLAWDMVRLPLGPWLSETGGVAPLTQSVTVQRATSDQLGLENFYQYAGTDTGGGTDLNVNQFSGNAVLGFDVLSNPSRGLASFLRLTYNSRDDSSSFAGTGWSVAASTITRLGSPLSFSGPNGLVGYPDIVGYVDGDGTGHTFELNKHGTLDLAQWTYDNPAGVHLYLQRVKTADGRFGTDKNRQWVMTRPEGTQFFFDAKGYHTVTADKNGNELRFTYETTLITNINTGVLTSVTDTASRRTLSLDYFHAGDSYTYFSADTRKTGTLLVNPLIIGKLKSVTDISGRKVTFTYSDYGMLREVVDGAGTALAKSYLFQYEHEPITVKLTRVTDPRGNVTTLDYFENITHHDLPIWGRVDSIVDRAGTYTYFDYGDPDGLKGEKVSSTVTDANQHTASAVLDSYGRAEELTSALGETTGMVWDADNNVVRLRENDGAVSTWEYDQLTGYPTKMTDAESVVKGLGSTVLTYDKRIDGYAADLKTKTTPEGRTDTFGYDAKHNVITSTDPIGSSTATAGDYTTKYTYDAFGQVTALTDANGNTTKYQEYDPTGFPRRIVDPFNNSSVMGYSATGDVLSSTDAAGHPSTFTYDVFRRELVTKTPKDSVANSFLTTPAPVYDANDNVTRLTAANGAITLTSYDTMDRQTSVTAPAQTGDPAPRLSTTTYDPVGNVLTETSPRGTSTTTAGDFTTTSTYDAVDRVVALTDAIGQRATVKYDAAGNMVTIVDARKNATTDANDFTTKIRYDLNHQMVGTTDASGATTLTEYDKDGNTVASTDEGGNRTVTILDKRGASIETRVPHTSGTGIEYFTTRYEYDQVGNRTRTITPRGVATTDDTTDYAETVVYDAMNRVSERLMPFKTGDADAPTTDRLQYTFDAVGNLATVSAPPSNNQTRRNVSSYDYYDNGWIRKATDPYGITTNYDYDALGQQTARSVVSAGGSASRTQAWTYFADGKVRSNSDDGVPVGQHIVAADNDDPDVVATGTWATRPATTLPPLTEGGDYRLHAAAATTTDSFRWDTSIPASGTYEVFARYPDGTATNARYTVAHDGGTTVKVVNQTQARGTWVSLGRFAFTARTVKNVTLSGAGNGTVAADAVRLVRDNSGDVDTERRTFAYTYDIDGNMSTLSDGTTGSTVDTYRVRYDGLDRADRVQEVKSGAVVNTTGYTYDENSNLTGWNHDDQSATYSYDARDLLARAQNGVKLGGAATRTTTFTYDPKSLLATQTKSNGNVTTNDYFADGLLKRSVEKKSGGATVNDHTLTYTPNGDRATEKIVKQNASNKAATLTTDITNTYDPRDRVRQVVKTGAGAGTETYKHDANDNVVSQTVKNLTTNFRYDRDRLKTAAAVGGTSSSYAYDAFGRLSTVSSAGTVSERYLYDGFDHTSQYTAGSGASAKTTTTTYDPLDRVTSRTVDSDTTTAKRTDMAYLGLTSQTLTERQGGSDRKSYEYSPSGELLGQIVKKNNGNFESSYFSYNAHSDVDSLTDETGDNRSTYAYTAYGSGDAGGTTGADQADAAGGEQVGSEPYNAFRFGTSRVDASSGDYTMGSRAYSPELTRFLSMDVFNGALSDMSLATNPFTLNRYGFASGNPLSMIDQNGHWPSWSDIGHATLDVVGLVPVVGEVADLANAGWYAAEGDYANAALSAASAVPFAGYAASAVKAGKYAYKGVKAAKATERTAEVVNDVRKSTRVAEAGSSAGKTTTKAAPVKSAPKHVAPPKPKPKPAKPAAGKPSGPPDTLYHYTNEAGQAGILGSKKLLPSLKRTNPKDAYYGDGQYLSDIAPGTYKNSGLSMSFIRNRFQGNRFSHYVEIDVRGLEVVQGRKSVYVIPNQEALDLTNRIVSYGKNMP